ncbi:hypothetical protein PoB_000467100 [Plakobranchus ocellatus]|uniref:Uncharacterized protein n=1 Tax=Plakobranchus ocellatus TaxID=259542 RepID=A0AAV3Y4P1_9GAST|nr:hypothetical protein PoB_000467100 [Plakobranchus ocellatus]
MIRRKGERIMNLLVPLRSRPGTCKGLRDMKQMKAPPVEEQTGSGILAEHNENLETYLCKTYSDPEREKTLEDIEGLVWPLASGVEFNNKPPTLIVGQICDQIVGFVVKAPKLAQMKLRTYQTNLDIMPSWIYPLKPKNVENPRWPPSEMKNLQIVITL